MSRLAASQHQLLVSLQPPARPSGQRTGVFRHLKLLLSPLCSPAELLDSLRQTHSPFACHHGDGVHVPTAVQQQRVHTSQHVQADFPRSQTLSTAFRTRHGPKITATQQPTTLHRCACYGAIPRGHCSAQPQPACSAIWRVPTVGDSRLDP